MDVRNGSKPDIGSANQSIDLDDQISETATEAYSQELANMHGRQTRSVMQSDWYKRLFPSTRLNPRRLAKHDFQTTRGGFRLSTSTGSTLTGRGGDILIVDDPLKADDAYSEVRRNSTLEWTRTTLFSRLDDKKRGVIINVQQRLHEDDLSGHLLRSGGWLHLNLAAIACALVLPGCAIAPAGEQSLPLVRTVPVRTGEVRVYSDLCEVSGAMEVVGELEVANMGRKRSAIEYELLGLAGRQGADAIVLHPLNRWALGAAYTSRGVNSFDPF